MSNSEIICRDEKVLYDNTLMVLDNNDKVPNQDLHELAFSNKEMMSKDEKLFANHIVCSLGDKNKAPNQYLRKKIGSFNIRKKI